MDLHSRLTADLVEALKNGDIIATGTLRMLLAAVHNREIELRSAGGADALDDKEILKLLVVEAKKRRDAIRIYKSASRSELAERERHELNVLERYLPDQLEGEALEHAVDVAVRRSGAPDFGTAMKAVMAELRGMADPKLIAEIVRRIYTAAP